MITRPKISVAMTTYNGNLYVREQISSIVSCLQDEDELIISDDGSTDNTVDTVNAFASADNRIKLICGPKKGIVKNFESAIKSCSGDIIFLSDQDDIWHKDKIEKILKIFENTEAEIVLHNANIYDNNSGKIVDTCKNVFGYRKSYMGNLIRNSFIGCCMAVKKDSIQKALPFPNNIYMHDWWIGLCVLKSGGGVVYIEEPLMEYRIHDGNSVGLQKNRLLKKLGIRITLAKEMALRELSIK